MHTNEEDKKVASPKRVIQFFWELYMTKKFYFFGLLIITIIVHVASLVPPLYYKKIIDLISGFTGTDKSVLFSSLIPVIIILIFIKFFSRAIWRVSDVFIINLETKLMKQMYLRIFDYLHKHSHNFFSNTFGGSLVKQTNKLVGSMENMTDIMIFEILPTILIIITTIIFISQQSLAIGLLILGWVLIYSTLQYFLQRWRMKHDIIANASETRNSGFIADCITNNTTIRTFGSGSFEYKNLTKLMNEWYKKARVARYSHTMIFALSGLLMFFLDIGSLYRALRLREQNILTVGFFILLQTYLMVIFGRMMFIGNNFRRLSRTISEAGEMIEILDTEHEIQDIPGAKPFKAIKGEIIFDDVKFTYTKEEESDIFSALSFKIKPGEKVALVGQSGSGKTSIIKLLYRFFDIQGGKILIDGQDISQVQQDSLRSNMSLVPQDPILFHRSLKENISYGNPDASDQEIIAASKMARCHDFISGFKSGYDTLVGERGIKLSGGERQRVAIARAILHNKNILLLDEATSALDSESEKLIQEAMEEVMKNKTVIIVAHRLSTIMKMDRIIVMDKGQIAQSGSHKELLLDKNGIYNKLRSIQSGGFVKE